MEDHTSASKKLLLARLCRLSNHDPMTFGLSIDTKSISYHWILVPKEPAHTLMDSYEDRSSYDEALQAFER
jgi:hypothetical protein